MPFEILNAIRAKSTIRVTGGVANTQINLVNLSANTALETVTNASIAQVSSVSNGIWRVYRGNDATGTLILDLPGGPTNLVLYEFDVSFANNSSSNVFIEHTGTSGTLIMQLAKTATYNPALSGM